MQHMDWDDLRFYLAVARKGSIRAASDGLAVNPSTVARRIDAFEKKLGVRLFNRLPTGYVLTPTGEDMLDSAERIEDEVATLDRQVFGRDAELNGSLRVTLPSLLATHLLMPDFAAFSRDFPGIVLEFALSSEEFNLSKREADVAIRLTKAPPDYLVGRRITHIAKAVYASTDYLQQHELAKYPEKMAWLGWEENEKHTRLIKESEFSQAPIHHQINDFLVQLEAAKAGMGLTYLPCFMADPVPSLQRISEVRPDICGDIWILTHKDLRFTARVRAFIDYMNEVFERHLDALQGKL